jgi:hypothetical protein
MEKCYDLRRKYFDKGIALLPILAKHVTIQGKGLQMLAIVFRAPGALPSNPRPTLIGRERI